MAISVRMSELDEDLVRAVAEYNRETVSAYIRRIVMKDIEALYEKVLDDFLSEK